MIARSLLLTAMAAGWFAFAPALAAADLRAEMEKFFTLGWQTTATAKAAAADQATVLEQLAPTDARVSYAQALVHMKQRRYSDAIASLDRVLAADKQNLAAWRGKIFLLMLTKEYGRAGSSIDALTAALPAEIAAASLPEWEETARFLGRMFGYLEGPAEGVPETQVATLRTKVESRLTGRLGSFFNEGRTGTLEKFAEMTGDKSRIQEENIVQAEETAAKTKEDLEKQKVAISERLTQLRSDADRARADVEKQTSDIDRQAAPLQGQLQVAAQVVNRLEGDLLNYISQINNLRQQAAREKDQIQRDRLLREADRLNFFTQRIDNDLVFARRNAATLNGQLATLANQRAAIQNRFAGEMSRIDREAKALGKQDTRIGAVTKKLDQPKTGQSPKTRALSVQAAALSTYDQFPLDAERDRLLATFQ